MTVRNYVRGELPFALSWWAFVFPVGALTVLAVRLSNLANLLLLSHLAQAFFGLLMLVWLAAAIGTVRGLVAGTIIPKPEKSAG